MISFIPVFLASGPLFGFFVGDFLQRRFNLDAHAPVIFAGIGFLYSIVEVIRIIKKVIAIDSNPK